MPASAAVSSMGATFKWETNAVAEVTSISGPSSKVDTLDVTHYGSANNYREFIATFIDGGEITVECNWIFNDTLGQVAMNTAFAGRTIGTALITLPDTTTLSAEAYIIGRNFTMPMDGKLGITFTLKISGAVTIGP
jgi:predicted secreted protein